MLIITAPAPINKWEIRDEVGENHTLNPNNKSQRVYCQTIHPQKYALVVFRQSSFFVCVMLDQQISICDVFIEFENVKKSLVEKCMDTVVCAYACMNVCEMLMHVLVRSSHVRL